MKYTKQLLFLLFAMFPLAMLAQHTVSGVVTDETNFPLPGASIVVKGTSKGEVTDFDGKFKITLSETPSTLVVSYLGYVTKEVIITDQKTISIVLKQDNEQLDEVVVIGYGEVDRKDLTGSVTSVLPKKDAVAQSQGVENLLQGRAAGVLVSANGTEPGAPSSIRIRGVNSLTGNTQPLYVIDGVIVDSATEDTLDPLSGGSSYLSPQGGISGINPRDIESIEVLKDASATAIYGSRGANGVILITTKQGKPGNAKINYSSTTKIGNITRNIDVLDPKQYIEYQNEYRANLGYDPSFYIYPNGSAAYYQTSEQYMIDNANSIDRIQGIDWSKDTYRSTINLNQRITASGGGDNNRYYYGAGFTDTKGLIPRTYAKSIDFVANLRNDLTDKLKLHTKISANYQKNSASKGTDNLGGTNNNLVRQIISGAPILNFQDNFFGTDFEESLDGPRAWIKDYDDYSREARILGSIKLDYDISDVFTYRVQFGGDYRNKERKVWYGTGVFRGKNANGEAGISTLKRFRYNVDNTLMFKKRFNNKHRINGTVGVIFDQNQIQRTTNQASDFPNKDLRADGISTGQVYQPLFFDKQQETIISFLGRFNYTLMNRYLFTATFRADGSSKFAEGKRWGKFPALAFAWKMNKEKFLRKVDWLSEAKLRLGWGLTGNQGIPNYRTITPFGPTQTPYSDANGGALTAIIPTNLANPDLTWETTSQYNAGFDLGIDDDRYTATVDVYYKKISDLLLNVEIGPSNGFENYYANQGDLINKGLEISLAGDIIRTDNFTWNLYGNISFNRNKIDRLGIPPAQFGTETYSAFLGRQVSGGNYFKVPANIFIEGQAPALFYGYATDGIISNEAQLSAAPTFRGIAPQLGDVYLVDQNNDGNITDADLTVIGDPNPDFNYGFGSSFEYKNLSLSFFFNGVQGNDIANGNLLREAYADANSNNIRTEAYVNAWRPSNPNGTYPRVGYDLARDTGFTDRLIEDGSFLRLNYVTLGYNIPVDNIPAISNAYISISGQNLLLFTKYSGFDPEVNSFSFDPLRVGLDWSSFPNQKSYSISLNITF
ncbi:SusC/RagA family TonB-linked outer membrane protein [Gaetbulibacter aestuarii]|uniref:TonB-dependent receptor n=1 Tax=Gaetbulibacter aestuarii TaxID=1502358 RepID=A0ABW7MX72_9FLAO